MDTGDQSGEGGTDAEVGDQAGDADQEADPSVDPEPDLVVDPGDDLVDAVADTENDGSTDGSDDVPSEDGGPDAGGDAAICASDCGTPAPTGGTNSATAAAQDVIIVAVDFDTDRVVLQNVSGEALTLANWWFCQGPGQYGALPTIAFAADGDRVVVDLLGTGTNNAGEVFAGLGATFNLGGNDTLALYRTNAAFSSNLNIEAFVQWRQAGVPPAGRESVATSAGLWEASTPVEVCGTNSGVVATGLVTDPANWRATADPEACLVE